MTLVQVFTRRKQRYGTRRLRAELQAQGYRVGRQRLRAELRRWGLRAVQPHAFTSRTTDLPGAAPPHKVVRSQSRRGECLDSAQAESLWSRLKTEELEQRS